MAEKEKNWALDSFLKEIEETIVDELLLIVEHRRVLLKQGNTVIIKYEQDQWEKDPNLVTQLVTDIVVGRRSISSLKERIEKRTDYYGNSLGICPNTET